MSEQAHYRRVNEHGSTVALTSTGDKFTFSPGGPCDVVRWGLLWTVTAGGAPVIAADKRITAGSDTGRVNAALGTITPGAAAAGTYTYTEPTTGPWELNPGDQVVIEVTTAATTTGSAIPIIEVRDRPFVDGPNARLADAIYFAS